MTATVEWLQLPASHVRVGWWCRRGGRRVQLRSVGRTKAGTLRLVFSGGAPLTCVDEFLVEVERTVRS